MGFYETIAAISPGLVIVLVVAIAVTVRIMREKNRHKEIMAAIEKGLPLSELKTLRNGKNDQSQGPNWVRKISFGVLFLMFSAGMFIIAVCDRKALLGDDQVPAAPFILIGMITLAFGSAAIVSGILNRNEAKKTANDRNTPDDSVTTK